jgi:hypothetical protein
MPNLGKFPRPLRSLRLCGLFVRPANARWATAAKLGRRASRYPTACQARQDFFDRSAHRGSTRGIAADASVWTRRGPQATGRERSTQSRGADAEDAREFDRCRTSENSRVLCARCVSAVSSSVADARWPLEFIEKDFRPFQRCTRNSAPEVERSVRSAKASPPKIRWRSSRLGLAAALAPLEFRSRRACRPIRQRTRARR